MDFEKEMIGTITVPEKDRLDEAALAAWLEANVAGYAGPLTLAKFKGGQSNPTYRLDTPACSYVLRRQPFGALLPSAHAVDREYRIIAALHPTGFPVPRPYGLCEDASVIGSKFYVMGLADGTSYWDGALPGKPPETRRAIYHAMVDTLADLHRIDPAAIGLGDYGKPGAYCERQVGRWSKQYRLAETVPIPEMDRLIEWLPTCLPPQFASAIVHGDYRLDNMIYRRDDSGVLAVLDWELSTLGDPIADFSYLMMHWVLPPDGRAAIGGLDLEALGIPSADDMTRRYIARTGFPMPPMDWYFAFNMFRLAAIVQGIRKRVIDGNATSPHALAMCELIEPLAKRGWEYAMKAGA
jgi:aminoglycoside phosphotransferase (APT) family kinase protein